MSSLHAPSPLPAGVTTDNAAFLLDFDGTLVDIASSPDRVVVPPGLRETLLALRARCGGALAIVTGRPIAQIDQFLPGVPQAVYGEHGAAFRLRPTGAPIERPPLPPLPAAWLAEAERLTRDWPGTRVERKHAGLVLHYRACPEAGGALYDAARVWLAGRRDFVLREARMAWEIRPAGIDKGKAVAALMARAPFAGRAPVFIGDDVTDEDGIAAAAALGGIGLRLPEDFAAPSELRAWLAGLASGADRDGDGDEAA